MEEISSDQVIINDFSQCSPEEIGEQVTSVVTPSDEPENTPNPNIYLGGDLTITQETVKENSEMSIKDIPEAKQTEQDSSSNEIAELENDKLKLNEENILERNSEDATEEATEDVQDSAGGNEEEPMEIEETHNTDVITTADSSKCIQIEVG